jgi:hypothetical protein
MLMNQNGNGYCAVVDIDWPVMYLPPINLMKNCCLSLARDFTWLWRN